MNKKYLGLIIVAVALVIVLFVYFVVNQNKAEEVVFVPEASELNTEVIEDDFLLKEELSEDQKKREALQKLMASNFASREEKFLEIGGWKKLSDQDQLDFVGAGIEIWFPEEWFVNGDYSSGRGAIVPIYQWPKSIEKTEENRNFLRGYFPELKVFTIEFLNTSSRILNLNEDYLRNYTPYISFEDTITEITISGFKAKKVTRVFLKPDHTTVTQYSVVLENLPHGFEFVDFSIYNDTYINTEEILEEIMKRVEIKK